MDPEALFVTLRAAAAAAVTGALVAACALVAGAGCGAHEDDDDEEARAPISRVDAGGAVVLTDKERAALGLLTTPAAQGTLTTSALRFGKVVGRPQEDALVVAPVTGRLAATSARLGEHVEARALLASLEPLVDAASRASLEAQQHELAGRIDAARAEVDANKRDLERVTALVKAGLATDAERAQAEAKLTGEQARADSLQRAGADLARTTGGRVELRAPAGGVVAELQSGAGALVEQGAVVARIVKPGPRWIDLAVPPGDAAGDAYAVRGIDATIDATLLSRGLVVQADGTRRDRLEVPPDAAGALLPGATVAVEVRRDVAGVVVPARAVVRRARERLVFVEVAAGRFAPRKVHVAASDELRAVIYSGLSSGDAVVARGAAALLGELGAAGGARPGAPP